MLRMEDALRAKRALDDWAEENKVPQMTAEEAETLEKVLLSPAGKFAVTNLRGAMWVIRDLWRCGLGPIRNYNDSSGISAAVTDLKEYRRERGLLMTEDHLETAKALLHSPFGHRAGSNIRRLDAAVTLLLQDGVGK